jgi:Ni/Fe-hydrogenase b-type cytochrome subunit
MTGSTASDRRAMAAASDWPTPAEVRFDATAGPIRAAYEHPWLVRVTHWLTAISLFVLVGSGLQIFHAFPSFGPKIPQENFFDPPEAFRIGGWLGGALMWHFTFMWIFIGAGAAYVTYQVVTGRYRMVLFTPKDVPGVWPMVKHYFFFKAKPPVTEPYNPLQKLAYTSTVLCGVMSVLTGLALFNPVQLSWLSRAMGGYSLVRSWHFIAMCGFLAFIPGHLVMVALHGWRNLVSMLVGWKRDPEYHQD